MDITEHVHNDKGLTDTIQSAAASLSAPAQALQLPRTRIGLVVFLASAVLAWSLHLSLPLRVLLPLLPHNAVRDGGHRGECSQAELVELGHWWV